MRMWGTVQNWGRGCLEVDGRLGQRAHSKNKCEDIERRQTNWAPEGHWHTMCLGSMCRLTLFRTARVWLV